MDMDDARAWQQFVHTLGFTDRAQLSSALQELMSADAIQDYTVDTPGLELRFLAPAPVARRLIERIYQAGGLRSCFRHPLTRRRVG